MSQIIEKSISHKTPGWTLSNGEIKLFLTEDAGMHAPCDFFADTDKPVNPYAVMHWNDERPDISFCPLLQNLRGDFFCLPFGDNPTEVDNFKYPPHGETAANAWKLVSAVEEGEKTIFTFAMDTTINPFHIEKRIEMRKGESALYLSHTVSGLEGKMPYGHHAICHMPEEGEKMYFSTQFDLGMTCPGVFSNNSNWEYQYLAAGETFDHLEKVPTAFKAEPYHDFSTYPSPVGYADLFAMLKKADGTPGWAAAVYPERGYLFYTLRNPETLPAVTIWTCNSGRYAFPWDGKSRCFAIEDNHSFFAKGIEASIQDNALTEKGWSTCGTFTRDAASVIPHIQGVVRVPADFGKVAHVTFENGSVIFRDMAGNTVSTKVDISFLGL